MRLRALSAMALDGVDARAHQDDADDLTVGGAHGGAPEDVAAAGLRPPVTW